MAGPATKSEAIDWARLEEQFKPAPGFSREAFDLMSSDTIVDANAIPELHAGRVMAAEKAGKILARNCELLAVKKTELVPIAVDVLGTGRRVVEAKRKYGVASPQYKELDTGLVLDCERVVGEAERKLTYEYFGDALQKRNQESGTYMANGVDLEETVTSGLSPLAKPEEQGRRVNDYVEEMGTYVSLGHIVKGLGSLAIGKTVSAYTVSECLDSAKEDYKLNPKGSHGGYVPEIDKFMAREVEFAGSGDRVERQLALSGVDITPKVIRTVLSEIGVIDGSQALTKTQLHSKQFVGKLPKGLTGFAQLLDREASKQSGKRIFMGEEVSEDHPMDYDAVPVEAEIRREKLAPKPRELADYVIMLVENGTDREVSEGLVNAYLKKMLLKVAKADPDKAEVMFDKATADGFRVVAVLQALGRDEEARRLQAEVERNAPEVSYCGAGSCGLESVIPNSPEAQKAKELGLKGDLLHDKERPCPSCSKMTVFYDSKGSKACVSCKSTEIKA
ncbi:MAG TPA: hypothetical protein VLG37_05690 [Candidatus Saccharimonadales bacterium]|nr:hypothetical protein [Candidatus Saccharimonadales bacterium]